MKKIIYIIFALIIGVLTTCNKEPDVRMPEMQDAVAAYLKLTDNSSISVDLYNLAGFTLEATVDVLFDDPFQKLAVVVVFNGDFENQHVLTDNITAVPQTVSYTVDDIVAVIPELNAATDIVAGDEFVFFVNTTMPDGSLLPGYTANGDIAFSSTLANALTGLKGATFDISIPVPCPFSIDDWPGTYDFYDVLYPSENTTAEITLDPEVENGLIVDGIWGLSVGAVPYKIVLHPEDFTVSHDEQQIGEDMWGYGPGTASSSDDKGTGTFNTCTFTINLYPYICVDAGCFGYLPIILVKQ
jgi:hypothetical protein